MDSLNTSVRMDCKHLASIWLQQQDLSGKSPVEISDMYFKAVQEIMANYNEKYAQKKKSEVTAHVITSGSEMDES